MNDSAEIVVLANRYKVHHFRNLEKRFEGRFAYEDSYSHETVRRLHPKLAICFDEHWGELGNLIGTLKQQGVATLQVMDGILEWRRTWDYGWQGHSIDGVINPINQPVLSHKVACLGRRDARIMESWGNFGKCEIVGAPRMDDLVSKRLSGTIRLPRVSRRLPRVLVMTAKTPGFTVEQVATTKRSLADLRDYFASHKEVDVVWRLTRELDTELGIENRLSDLTGGELHAILEEVDAVITTPSTAMLEAMLLNRPVALLDYHNCPHYFEAAWSIFSCDQIAPIIREVLAPQPARMDYQAFLLDEQLACQSPASDRLSRLIEGMLQVHRQSVGLELKFPVRMLDDQDLFVTSPLPLEKFRKRYPEFPVPDDMPMREMKIELAAARGTIRTLYEKIERLERRLSAIPGISLLRNIRRALWRK